MKIAEVNSFWHSPFVPRLIVIERSKSDAANASEAVERIENVSIEDVTEVMLEQVRGAVIEAIWSWNTSGSQVRCREIAFHIIQVCLSR